MSNKTKTSEELIAEIKKLSKKRKKHQPFSDTLINLVMKLHYTGMNASAIERATGISNQQVSKWKREFGTEMTHVAYGTTTRNDVRTKCLAVREFLVDNKTSDYLSKKYHVGTVTIIAWVKKYEDDYEQWLDAPDGITTVAKKDRLIYGNANITEIREKLIDHGNEIKEMIQSMQKNGIMVNAVAQAENLSKKTQEEIKTLDAAEQIIKKGVQK